MTNHDVRDIVRRHLAERVGDTALTDERPIFTSGLVDSFGVLELIAFLEETFGIQIDTAEYEFVEFDTVAKIASIVERCGGSSGPRS